MRRTIHKLFPLWAFDKEERWLNEMAARGLSLVSVGYCSYTFEVGDPGEYIVRLELLEQLPTHAQSEQYIRFIEGSGAECIGSWLRWAYFRKKRSMGEFDLYSDFGCRIKHLNRIITFVGVLEGLWAMYTALYLPALFEVGARDLEKFMGVLSAVLFALLTYGIIRLLFKKRKLTREHLIYE